VLVITAQGQTITAIEAMKWERSTTCPSTDLPLLEQQVTRAARVRKLMSVPVERGLAARRKTANCCWQQPGMQSVWKPSGGRAQDGPTLVQGSRAREGACGSRAAPSRTTRWWTARSRQMRDLAILGSKASYSS